MEIVRRVVRAFQEGFEHDDPAAAFDSAPLATDVEWITPIPDCADDLSVDVIDAGSEQPIDALLFGHTTHVTYFFGVNPVRLILRACNGDPASPGGVSTALAAIVGWGG